MVAADIASHADALTSLTSPLLFSSRSEIKKKKVRKEVKPLPPFFLSPSLVAAVFLSYAVPSFFLYRVYIRCCQSPSLAVSTALCASYLFE